MNKNLITIEEELLTQSKALSEELERIEDELIRKILEYKSLKKAIIDIEEELSAVSEVKEKINILINEP